MKLLITVWDSVVYIMLLIGLPSVLNLHRIPLSAIYKNSKYFSANIFVVKGSFNASM